MFVVAQIMYTLYQFSLCPFSRKVRMALAEKSLEHHAKEEPFWERRSEFAALNPALQVPVLCNDEGVIADCYAIMEYLDVTSDRPLFTKEPKEDAEIRRIVSWFDHKFYHEVSRYLLNEKLYRYYLKQGEPCSDALRAAKANLDPHLKYAAHLLKDKRWCVGEKLSWADITIAAHLSVVDYFGEIDWRAHHDLKEWYLLIKSRPSFRPLLRERVRGFHPPAHYEALDF